MATRYSKKNRLEDFNYFLKNYNKIYNQYGHTFVVIKNRNILGAYNNVEEALENTKEPIGTYILQECNGNESGYTSYISSFNLFTGKRKIGIANGKIKFDDEYFEDLDKDIISMFET